MVLTKMMKNDEEEEAVRKAMMSDTVHVHVHFPPTCRSSCVVVMMTIILPEVNFTNMLQKMTYLSSSLK